jgi:hypothetical protein
MLDDAREAVSRRSPLFQGVCSLHRRSRRQAGPVGGYPLECPVGLSLDAGNGFDGVEKIFSAGRVFNVGINEKGIRLRVDIFHHDLETVKAASLDCLHFVRESFDKILIYDTVRSREKSKYM